MRKPEIMSPAGYWPQLRAAIEAGADAVYFGLKHFTARAKVGFDPAELPEVMRTLHRRGVKGYVTFNTLVFDHELDEAAHALASIAQAGADSIIVQDWAVVKMARRIAPGLNIHGSTQMSVTSADGVRFAQSLGVSRVVMARELSLDDVRAIRAAVNCELEMFVHGALCVSYSGQCFSSEAWGGRSANRGQCAQACRLPYDLMVDGKHRPLGDARYLLSPGDLYALRQIPEIVQIGISALKIEGRYKDSDYVALTTRAYRQAVDEAWAAKAEARTARPVDPATELQLQQVYSRGLGPHFISGTNHQTVVNGRAPRHRGVLMGRVTRVSGSGIAVEPISSPAAANSLAPLKPGDGVVFDAADWRSPQEHEEGGRVFEVAVREGGLELRFGNGAIDASRIRRGDLVWRTHDPDLDKAVRPFLDAATPVHKQPVSVRVTAREGSPLVAEWRVGEASAPSSVTVQSPKPLGAARSRGLDAEFLSEQFGRLGNTPYELDAIELEIAGTPFAPSSLLNQLRREAVERLQEKQAAHLEVRHPPAGLDPDAVRDPAATLDPAAARGPDVVHDQAAVRDPAAVLAQWQRSPRAVPGGPVEWHLLVRTPEQMQAAVDLRPASITLDYLDLYGLRPSLERIRAAGLQPRVASPRVLKPGEERIADFLVSCDCPILVRSAGLLHALRGRPHAPLIGDFSLNAANAISAAELLDLGLSILTPTHDLNAAQVAGLARHAGADRVEAVVFHHLPVFHTEHCVFCRFLSAGTSYLDCGRPCENHRVALRDAAGREHPVMADVGCRNTVFGAEAQQAAMHLDDWRSAGIRHFRIEFAHESAAQATRIARAFDDALTTRRAGSELAQILQRIAPQGVTEGSLYVPESPLTVLQ